MLLRLFIYLCCLLYSLPAIAGNNLQGVWVDSRTNDDFWEIKGDNSAFRFIVYGGESSSPRYLSQGVALAISDNQFSGALKDLPGYCCGQIGSVEITVINMETLQVTGKWWPANAQEPADSFEPPFLLKRQKQSQKQLILPALENVYVSKEEDQITKPVSITDSWAGTYVGDGWANFFVTQEKNILKMLWYYSEEPKFYGIYELTDTKKEAHGIVVSVSKDGDNSYYQHHLALTDKKIQVISYRLAAPLNNGDLVVWKTSPPVPFILEKQNDNIPAADKVGMEKWFAEHDPRTLYSSAIEAARVQGKLIQRDK